jgi:hypothetical protein
MGTCIIMFKLSIDLSFRDLLGIFRDISFKFLYFKNLKIHYFFEGYKVSVLQVHNILLVLPVFRRNFRVKMTENLMIFLFIAIPLIPIIFSCHFRAARRSEKAVRN